MWRARPRRWSSGCARVASPPRSAGGTRRGCSPTCCSPTPTTSSSRRACSRSCMRRSACSGCDGRFSPRWRQGGSWLPRPTCTQRWASASGSGFRRRGCARSCASHPPRDAMRLARERKPRRGLAAEGGIAVSASSVSSVLAASPSGCKPRAARARAMEWLSETAALTAVRRRPIVESLAGYEQPAGSAAPVARARLRSGRRRCARAGKASSAARAAACSSLRSRASRDPRASRRRSGRAAAASRPAASLRSARPRPGPPIGGLLRARCSTAPLQRARLHQLPHQDVLLVPRC